MNNSFEQLELIVSGLPLEKKQLLIKLLNGQVLGQSCLYLLTEHQNSASSCPHCHSHSIKRNGKINNRQRYLYKSCSKSYMSTFNTPFYRLREPEKWLNYFSCMLNSLTVRKTAASCLIAKNIAFLWRHKFHKLLNIQDNTFDKRLESYTGKAFYQLLNNHIDKDSVVCSDGFQSYRVLTNKLEIGHKVLNFTKGIRVIEKVFHIQNINSYHGRLHGWIRHFNGVATKYLDNYLSWYRFFDANENPNENPNENSMLLSKTQLIVT